jgi:hypothetical protein
MASGTCAVLWRTRQALSISTVRILPARFDSMARSTAYLLAKSLVKKVWFKETKKPIRGAGGFYSSRHYKVLTHDEWIKEHPHDCPPPIHSEDKPIHNSASDEVSPVHSGDHPIHFTDAPIHLSDSPVHFGVPNLIEIQPSKKLSDSEQLTTPASQAEALIDRFSRGGGKRAKAAAEAARASTPRPVLDSGLDGSRDTRAEAERLSIPITNQLGIRGAQTKTEWTAVIQRLLDHGRSVVEVRDVADFVYSKMGVKTMLHGGPSGFETRFDQLAECRRKLAARTTEGMVN